MSIPTLNVSNLIVGDLHLDKIEVDDVLLHHLDTHGYAHQLYTLFLFLFTFVLLQTIAMGYIFVSLMRKTRMRKGGLLDSLTRDIDTT
jgi:hypothetical protein